MHAAAIPACQVACHRFPRLSIIFCSMAGEAGDTLLALGWTRAGADVTTFAGWLRLAAFFTAGFTLLPQPKSSSQRPSWRQLIGDRRSV